MAHQFKDFAASLRIKLLNSSPYYTQANGQADVSNKTMIGLIKKKIEERPRSGMRSYLRHCGHAEHLSMVLLR
jgi:hypothetical protein